MRMTKLNESMFGSDKQQACQRHSRGGMFERTMSGNRFRKEGMMDIKRTLHIFVAFVLVLSAAPVSAGSAHASGEEAIKARTALQFLINIPETLHMRSGTERRALVRSFTSRTTHTEHDRVVVTVAKP